MKTRWLTPRGGRLLGVLLAACMQATALADDAESPARVARLSDVEGPVSLEPAGVADWTAATLNRPLTSGDRLWADQNARAELDLGDAAVRLGADTGFAFFELDDDVAQMQLTGGVLIVRVRDLTPNQVYEVDTPNLAVSLQQNGEYRLEVNARGDVTTVKVADGAAQALGGGSWLAISAGQSVTFSGTGTLAYSASSLGPADGFDMWSEARDQALQASAAAAYLPSDMPGAADLDGNGSWQQSPDYGYVWTPTTVIAGWVPYRFGRWLWVSPWGWTWVDDAPWGYAPFHYGRWVTWHNGWCWVPGSRVVRPAYAPALVGWLGGTTEVGWFPLGPGEPYLAPFGAGYLRRINLASNAALSADHGAPAAAGSTHFLNAHGAALSRVPRDVFTSGQRVNTRLLHIPLPLGVTLEASAPAIAPNRQSVLGLAQGHGVPRPPPQAFERSVVARRAPPPAPAPFDRVMASLQAGEAATAARNAPAVPRAPMSAVRLIAPSGAPVTLNVPHAVARRPEAPLSLAARERILERSQISGATGVAVSQSAAAVAQVNAFVPPELSEDGAVSPGPRQNGSRPAGRQPEVHTAPRQSENRPSAVAPPYHAAGMPLPTSSQASAVPIQHHPSLTPAPLASPNSSAPAHAAHPSATGSSTASRESSREPRDGGPHADRASRERALR